MSLCCVVCGEWYPTTGPDRLDMCQWCLDKNFSGTQPPLDPGAPRAADPLTREALEAFVDSAHQMTPRQVEAMRRMATRWQQEEAC